MKRKWYAGILFYSVAPFVVIGGLVAFVLTGYAAYENYRLGKAAEQMLYIVGIARDLHISGNVSRDVAQSAFFSQIKQAMPSDVVQVSNAFLGQGAQLGIKNPWGDVISLTFYPEAQAFRLETPLSASACRRILSLYAKSVDVMGLRRIDVRSADAGAVWRLLYKEKTEGAALTTDVIHGGCGNGTDDVLSLTFYL